MGLSTEAHTFLLWRNAAFLAQTILKALMFAHVFAHVTLHTVTARENQLDF